MPFLRCIGSSKTCYKTYICCSIGDNLKSYVCLYMKSFLLVYQYYLTHLIDSIIRLFTNPTSDPLLDYLRGDYTYIWCTTWCKGI
nr:MAG TPA: hypothetical protein [Crassvirales sp.]